MTRLSRCRIEVETMPRTDELAVIEPGTFEAAPLMRTLINDRKKSGGAAHETDRTLPHGHAHHSAIA